MFDYHGKYQKLKKKSYETKLYIIDVYTFGMCCVHCYLVTKTKRRKKCVWILQVSASVVVVQGVIYRKTKQNKEKRKRKRKALIHSKKKEG